MIDIIVVVWKTIRYKHTSRFLLSEFFIDLSPCGSNFISEKRQQLFSSHLADFAVVGNFSCWGRWPDGTFSSEAEQALGIAF